MELAGRWNQATIFRAPQSTHEAPVWQGSAEAMAAENLRRGPTKAAGGFRFQQFQVSPASGTDEEAASIFRTRGARLRSPTQTLMVLRAVVFA